jgi:hypothetical protein
MEAERPRHEGRPSFLADDRDHHGVPVDLCVPR